MSTFLDPSFKHLDFIPQTTPDEARFMRNLLKDTDTWMVAEMKVVVEKLEEGCESNSPRLDLLTYTVSQKKETLYS